MNKYEKENLESLSKEQLIKIIEDWDHQLFYMGCACVDVSKCHLDYEEATEKIRKCLCETDKYKFNDENLGSYIDFQLGKISVEEMRKIVLGE